MTEFRLKDLAAMILDLLEDLQLQANQSILKHDHSQGLASLGGMDALRRLETRIALIWPEYRFSAHSEKSTPARQSKVRPLRGKMR
jgi:hypothetical protein